MDYSFLKKYSGIVISRYKRKVITRRINKYIYNGRIPWSYGYDEFKIELIKKVLNSDLTNLSNLISERYGIGIDERIVEYPWIFSKIKNEKARLLDAGSTFNFDFIINHDILKNKKLFIYTFNPEGNCFHAKGISYIYGDLRDILIKDNQFDIVVSQSTIEHIGMNNSIYGHNSFEETQKNYEYIQVIIELVRVLKGGGRLLLTFPYGKYENHSFFQQFDREMLERIQDLLKQSGVLQEISFFKYLKNGWVISRQDDVDMSQSFNPHTGVGKNDDNAAHSRAVCCIEFIKN